MSGYLDFFRKVFDGRATDIINQLTSGFTSSSNQPAAPGSPDASLPSQLVYPQDLFSADSAPFILFFAVDPVKVNTILDKIALYMPKDIEVHYGINFSEATNYFQYANMLSDNTVAQFLADPWVAGTAAYGLGKAAMSGGGAMGSGIAGLQSAMQVANQSNSIGQTLAINRKRTLNPHLASIFEGVSFRRHPFTFDLVARNQAESDTINQIIYKFKLHAHPEAGNPDSQNTFMQWPSAWQVGLFSPARKYLYNISTCHLTNVHVNYTNGGMRAFFSDTGAPVSIRLNLEFMETELMTRGRIRQGF